MFSALPLKSRIFKSHHSANRPILPPGKGGECRHSYRQWEDVSMQKAACAVEGGISLRKAAELYAIPKSTLFDHVTGRIPFGAKSGPVGYLTNVEEEELLHFLLKCSDIGYAHSRKQILSIVQQIIDGKGIDSVVTNGWWERFSQQHPEATLRTAAPLSYSRAIASDRESITNYFDLLEITLLENDIFNKPANIFNLDETGFPLNPKPPKVLSRKGAKNPIHLTGDCKAQVTVLACTSAAGYALPPFVIWDRKTLNPEYTLGEVPGTIYGLSQNGWMDKELFSDWFFHHFLLYAPPSRPLLLLMDGHSTHYCPEVIREAAAQKVIIFVLPPNTTHCTQPLDKGAFSSLKIAWRQTCHDFLCFNLGRTVTRYDFSKLFSSAWFEAMSMPNIISGFRITGICPFDRDAFKLPGEGFTRFKPEALQEETGLAYIPMYSPRRSVMKESWQDSPGLKLSSCLPPPKPVSSISKHLTTPIPPSAAIPVQRQKVSGRVLTSAENIELMEQKQHDKMEKLRKKEMNQKRREENRKKKERERVIKEENRKKKEREKMIKAEVQKRVTSLTKLTKLRSQKEKCQALSVDQRTHGSEEARILYEIESDQSTFEIENSTEGNGSSGNVNENGRNGVAPKQQQRTRGGCERGNLDVSTATDSDSGDVAQKHQNRTTRRGKTVHVDKR